MLRKAFLLFKIISLNPDKFLSPLIKIHRRLSHVMRIAVWLSLTLVSFCSWQALLLLFLMSGRKCCFHLQRSQRSENLESMNSVWNKQDLWLSATVGRTTTKTNGYSRTLVQWSCRTMLTIGCNCLHFSTKFPDRVKTTFWIMVKLISYLPLFYIMLLLQIQLPFD